MKLCIIASKTDVAAMNMYVHAAKKCTATSLKYDDETILSATLSNTQIYLISISQSALDVNDIDERLQQIIGEFDIVLFLSKHASVSKIPTLCIHTQGNWGSADLGGSPKTLGVCPVVLKNMLYEAMVRDNPTSFDVVHEATHHGPDLKTPCIFYEIGSTHEEWCNEQLGNFMVQTLFSVLEGYVGEHTEKPVFFGIGGSHTCSNFNRLSAQGKALISHVVPNYALDSLTEEMVSQAIEKSTIVPQIVVDWKSLNSKQRQLIELVLSRVDLPYVKLKQFKSQLDTEHI